MDTSVILLIANIAVWLGIFGYLAFLGSRQRQLDLRLTHLEMVQRGYEKE